MKLFRALAAMLLTLLALGVHQCTAERHTNNWAVIVDTSVFWFNYRHVANALGIYRMVKELGIPDSQIILMLAHDMACNLRNTYKAEMFNNNNRQLELYGDNIEVDYRGNEVTVEAFLRVLTGRHPPGTPASKRLDTDDGSNVLIYMTGHGGDGFLKFRDSEELSSQDVGETFEQMFQKKRYKEMFYLTDTCEANTMFQHVVSPGIISVGSAEVNENSYSHHADNSLGVAVIDRFTYYTLEFLNNRKGSLSRPKNPASLLDLFRSYQPNLLHSHAGWNSTASRPLNNIPVADFFASDLDIRTGVERFPLKGLDPAAPRKTMKDIRWELPTKH